MRLLRLLTAGSLLAAALFLTDVSHGRGSDTGTTGACGDGASLSWEPTAPRQGALFRVVASGIASGTRLSGEVARQPLHFVDTGEGRAEAFAAIPVDGTTSLGVVVRCSAHDQSDSLVAQVSATRADYPIDRLTVSPRFGTPPDSATAERIRRESRRALEVAERAHDTPRLWRAPFVRPRPSRITSGFGRGREFNGQITSRHMGTDFAGAVGAPVHAVSDGVVRIVDSFFYGGNVVYVDHGAGLTSAYLHLSRQDVAQGDTVQRGQVIGRVGATGRVTGPHLHFILRYGDITVDPMSLFALTEAPEQK
jgi:murein DD-endopeptidase MepM/ murein hydrolase activator NlpD